MKKEVNIKKVPINQVKNAPYNVNVVPSDMYELLKKNLQEFGLVQPLVVNARSGYVVGGNHRLKILKELGQKTVMVAYVDLPEAKEIALSLALNRIHGEPDIPRLKDLLGDLDTGGFDIELTGYDEFNIENLFDYTPEDILPPEGGGKADDLKFSLAFNSAKEQATWQSFLAFLESKHSGLKTNEQRICAHAKKVMSEVDGD